MSKPDIVLHVCAPTSIGTYNGALKSIAPTAFGYNVVREDPSSSAARKR